MRRSICGIVGAILAVGEPRAEVRHERIAEHFFDRAGCLRLTVLLVMTLAAGLAAAGVLFNYSSSRAPLVVQTIFNVLLLFLLFRVHRTQKGHARDVQQKADAILAKLKDNQPKDALTTQTGRRPENSVSIM